MYTTVVSILDENPIFFFEKYPVRGQLMVVAHFRLGCTRATSCCSVCDSPKLGEIIMPPVGDCYITDVLLAGKPSSHLMSPGSRCCSSRREHEMFGKRVTRLWPILCLPSNSSFYYLHKLAGANTGPPSYPRQDAQTCKMRDGGPVHMGLGRVGQGV